MPRSGSLPSGDTRGAAAGSFFPGPTTLNWIAADILRIEDGVLVEHWDVIQDEATQEQSKSGRPMFGDSFPRYR
jgi:predicted SnoaL-like aldol condensation-catalyzing enzyme